MFKSIRVFINKKDGKDGILDQVQWKDSLGSKGEREGGSKELAKTHCPDENNRVPLSDLPEDLLVLESREKQDFDQIDIENETIHLDDMKDGIVNTCPNGQSSQEYVDIEAEENLGPASNERHKQLNNSAPTEQDLYKEKDGDVAKLTADLARNLHEQISPRFNHFKNYIGYKTKKVYFDNINVNESLFKDVVKGESVGVLIGSVGVSSPANNHAILKKLALEIKEPENASLVESCEILMGRFAVTDAKLMDLNSERNVSLSSYVEKNHVTQKISASELQKILASPSLTSLSSCTIFYFKWSQNIVGKLYLIDVKDPDFGMSSDDLSSSSISLTSLQGKLRESMLKLSNIAKILGNAGAEGLLDFNFPLGVCSRELFGGRAHAYLSFDLIDTSNITDSQLSHFLEFCSASRRIRNRIESNSIDSALISLQEKFSQLESNLVEKSKELEEKENIISELKDTCKDLNELADEHRQEIINLNSQLSELTLKEAEKEQEFSDFQSEMKEKLGQAVNDYQLHLDQCLQDKQQSNIVQVQALKESVAAAERVNAIEAQLLKTKILEYQTLLLEIQEENRSLLAKNAILEYERNHYTENISFYTTLHEKDLASILKAKQDLAELRDVRSKLNAELNTAAAKFEESQVLISSLKDESRDLTKQLVTMQQQLLDRTDNAFAQASKQDQMLYNDFLAKNKQLEALKSQLEEAELAKVNLQSQIEKLQMKLSTMEDKFASKQADFTKLQNRLEKIESKCNSLVEENTLLRDKVDEFLANDATVTRNGLQQTISLLETQLDNAKNNISNTASIEQISYQEKLEEARRAQINMMEKMLERESAWAKEKQELLLVKRNAEEISSKSQKRLISQMDHEIDGAESGEQAAEAVKRIKAKKNSENGPTKVCSRKTPKEAKTIVKRSKKVVAEFVPIDDGERKVVEEEEERKSSNHKEKSFKVSKTIELAKAKISSNVIKEIVNAAEGQTDDGTEPAIAVVKKKINKKIAPTLPSMAKNILKETTNGDSVKENANPLQKENTVRKDLFCKKDSSQTVPSVPKLGGLLSGFLKRPSANPLNVGVSNPESQVESLEDDSTILLPKIPQKYLDKRRLDMIAGGQ